MNIKFVLHMDPIIGLVYQVRQLCLIKANDNMLFIILLYVL